MLMTLRVVRESRWFSWPIMLIFFPLAMFLALTFSSQFSLPVQIYLAYQVLIRKMYFYLRSRWFTDAAKNNVKQTQ